LLNCHKAVLTCYAAPRSFGDVIDKRKAEVAGYAVAAFVIVLLALRLLGHGSGGDATQKLSLDQPSRGSAGASGPGSGGDGTGAGAVGGAGGKPLVVDVAGEVRRPGVYRLPPGARADLAVQRAGGVTRRGVRTAVNLAMPLRDGQQIVVPRRGAAPAVAGVPGAGGTAGDPGGDPTQPAQPISLSTATVAQLDTLDGIGPTLAGRIVQYRDSHGGFRSIDELRQVDGIGDKRFASLRKAVQP
jgi:competence protein ComEA